MRKIVKKLLLNLRHGRVVRFGSNSEIGFSSKFVREEFFQIGKNFFCGQSCYFSTNEFCPVWLGDDVMFGPQIMVLGGSHDYRYTDGHIRLKKDPSARNSKIIIEDGVWVGARAIILDGAVIREGAIIGAGEVVRSEVPPYSIWVNGHAKPRFKNADELSLLLMNVSSNYSVAEITTQLSSFEATNA